MSAGGTHIRIAAVLAATVTVAVAAGCGGGDDGAGPLAASGVPVAAARTGGGALVLQQQFERVVRAVSPAVVQVQTGGALGSGVVFDGRGDIVTNAHVVDDSTRFLVTLADGQRHPAALLGVDRRNDLAVIRISGARPRPATLGDSSRLKSGDLTLAIGNPLGLRSSVTQGIISGERQAIAEGNGVTLPSVMQTSAEINPGNSGGALVDLTGRVIGIPTLAALDPDMGDNQAPGIGFAIPSNTVRAVATRLIGE